HTSFFLFNAPATTVIYTLSLHDALPICRRLGRASIFGETACGWSRGSGVDDGSVPGDRAASAGDAGGRWRRARVLGDMRKPARQDRKSTRLNSSHVSISYAVFCLKKKS